MNEEDIDSKYICYNCVKETILHDEIKRKGNKHICSYCSKNVRCYSIPELSARIDYAFQTFYERTSEFPDDYESRLLDDDEGDFYFERHGDPVLNIIMDIAWIDEPAAADVQEFLADENSSRSSDEIGEETEYASDSHYELKSIGTGAWQSDWTKFEDSLKFKSRFFNSEGSELLNSIFEGIEKQITHDKRPLIVTAGPGQKISHLFRARVFQNEQQLRQALSYPDQELGPPPSKYAATGRMNAAGISSFYGATDPSVSIAEVRPPVGSNVAVARFDITRNIKLLDLAALSKTRSFGSYFDENYLKQSEKANFLRNLSARMTRPVMPDDTSFDYLCTQAIADFLASDLKREIDGIIFPSAQTVGEHVNVVLFNKASLVKKINYPKGTTIDARTEQETDLGPEKMFEVFVKTPHILEEDPTIGHFDSASSDTRITTLEIKTDSITVHSVESVNYKTIENYVSWFEFNQLEIPPYIGDGKASDW